MKRLPLLLIWIFLMPFLLFPAQANMAAPQKEDVGSSITFEKNQQLAVLSQVLDIQVQGSQAAITACYTMKNTTQEEVTTETMFLSPNVEESGTQVTVGGQEVPFSVERYGISYDTRIATQDWRYAVLSPGDGENTAPGEQVDSITFEMTFQPEEQLDVIVSYRYRLGGYPDLDFNAKYGRIRYYLAPAAMWKDFGNLTIHLQLDNAMPVLKESNLDFEKVGKGEYQYSSPALPEGNLEITIDENWFQTIFSILRNPYLPMMLLMFSPLLLILLLAVLFFLWRRKKKKKSL